MTFLRVASVAFSGLVVPALLLAQGGAGGGQPPKNLQVLPKDMTRQQVTAVMTSFTSALGVRCEHCHIEDKNAPPPAAAPAGGRGGGPALDFASDDKETKKIAREMLKMVNDINTKYLPLTGRTTPERDKVNCETCHHGLSKPQSLRSALAGAVEVKGADSATALYRTLRTRYYGSASYDFSENALNVAAQDLARMNQRPAGLALLRLNLEFYDKSASTYQTMGQMLVTSGDTAGGIAALNKAVELQPNNPQVRQMLQRLGVTTP